MQQRSEETRSRILKAAVRRFSDHGYEAASVEAICEDARVSKGAFYHHFPSKHALFLALLDSWLKSLDGAVPHSGSENIPATLLGMTDAFRHMLVSASDRLPMFLEFWLKASRDPKVWRATVAPYRRYHAFFTSLIEQGIREGSLADVDASVAARMISSIGMGLLLQSLLDPQGAEWDQVAMHSMQTLLRGLARTTTPASSRGGP